MDARGTIELSHVSKKFRVVEKKGRWTELWVRHYREVEAVKNISVKIETGEIVGYIGPNGAGKSTSIKLMCGTLIPDGGEALLNGLEASANRKKNARDIGVVFGQRSQLWWDLPVNDSFVLLKEMYGIPDKDYNDRRAMFDDILGLNEFSDIPVRSLSLGQKMRAEIAAAFLHYPSIVLLDEPTIGLDIVSKRNILNFIKWINEEYHITILLTTHDLSEIEAICHRIVIIDKGEMLFDDEIGNFYERYGNRGNIVLKLDSERGFPGLMTVYPDIDLNKKDDKYIIKYDRNALDGNKLISWLYQNCDIADISVGKESLEDIVHNLYVNKNYGQV